MPVDLTLNAAGATGKVTFAGVPVDLIAMKGNLYIRGAASVLGGFLGPKAAAMIGRHWVQLSTSMPQLAQFSALTDKTQLVQQLLTAKSPSKVGTRTIAGLKTVEIRGYGTDGNGTLFVAATGTSYPVQLVTSVGTVHFSGWNAPITVTAPSDVISLASLTG